MQNGHRTVEKIDFFQRQFFQEFYSFRQLRQAPQSSLAAKRTDFRRLRHEISRVVNCQKPFFAKNFSIFAQISILFAGPVKDRWEWIDYELYYQHLKVLGRIFNQWYILNDFHLEMRDGSKGQLPHQQLKCLYAQLSSPSLGRLLHFIDHRVLKKINTSSSAPIQGISSLSFAITFLCWCSS